MRILPNVIPGKKNDANRERGHDAAHHMGKSTTYVSFCSSYPSQCRGGPGRRGASSRTAPAASCSSCRRCPQSGAQPETRICQTETYNNQSIHRVRIEHASLVYWPAYQKEEEEERNQIYEIEERKSSALIHKRHREAPNRLPVAFSHCTKQHADV